MAKIAVMGSSGLLGSALVDFLQKSGHEVKRLKRNKKGHYSVANTDLNGCDVVINLAGENVVSGRWTKRKKRKIYQSRVESTEALSRAIFEMQEPPKLWINGSATGFYGDQEDRPVDENSPSGQGFLAEVCKRWEAAAKAPSDVRLVLVRTGLVLTPKGGALGKLLLPFKLGLGGVIGSGKQWMSWISLEDWLNAVSFIISQEQIHGPVNVVTPNPVTNREFTKTLGAVLHRPTILPLPAFAARLLFGQMADEMLLSSLVALPNALSVHGFPFQYPRLKEYLTRAID